MSFSIFGLTIAIGWWDLLAILLIALVIIRLITSRVRKKQLTHTNENYEGVTTSYAAAAQTIKKLAAGLKVIVVVDVKGIILNEARDVPFFARKSAAFGLDLRKFLRKLSIDPNVAGVIGLFNTPGGSVTGSRAVFEGFDACTKAGKPTVAYVSEISASGGVLGMMGVKHIVANPDALLGSIGVRGPQLFTYEGVTTLRNGLFGQEVTATRITSRVLSEGKGKDFGNPFAPPDKEAEDKFKKLISQIYDRFLALIQKARGIPRDVLLNKGALIFGAEEALACGLVDKLGSQEDAEVFISRALNIPADGYVLVHVTPSRRERIGLLFASAVSLFGVPVGATSLQLTHSVLNQQPVTLMADIPTR